MESHDKRRSPIVARQAAKEIKEEDRLPSEDMTIILSKNGWIRAAKGSEYDLDKLSYKSGDSLQDFIVGKSNQYVSLFDSTGRVYSLPIHNLPSARGHGEPVTAKLTPPAGAQFEKLFIPGQQKFLLTQDSGYGFVVSAADLQVKTKSGKQIVNVMKEAKMLKPVDIQGSKDEYIALISSDSRMLCFPLSEVPQLAKGKGNKLMNIPSAMQKTRELYVERTLVFSKKSGLVIKSSRKTLTLKGKDLDYYVGTRGIKGNKLPKDYQKVADAYRA